MEVMVVESWPRTRKGTHYMNVSGNRSMAGCVFFEVAYTWTGGVGWSDSRRAREYDDVGSVQEARMATAQSR